MARTNTNSGGGGGGTIGGSIAATQIAYGSGTNTITGDSAAIRIVGTSTIISDVFHSGMTSSIQLSNSLLGSGEAGAALTQVTPSGIAIVSTLDYAASSHADYSVILQSKAIGGASFAEATFDGSASSMQGGILFKYENSPLQSIMDLSNNNASLICNNGSGASSGIVAEGTLLFIENNSNSWEWPSTIGAAGSVLTDVGGTGVLTWQSGGGGSGVTQIIAGTGVTISPSGGTGVVTVNSFVNNANAFPIQIVNTTSLFSTGMTGMWNSTATNSLILGTSAGDNDLGTTDSVFWVGTLAGASDLSDTMNASQSTFIGNRAGFNAFNSEDATFIGYLAGAYTTNASYSVFMGAQAGESATWAGNSFFFGQGAGQGSTYAAFSTFIGLESGSGAEFSQFSSFIGSGSGATAAQANNSIFIGANSGFQDLVNNLGTLAYSSESNVFASSQRVVGGTSGATAYTTLDNGTGDIFVTNTVGAFIPGETVTQDNTGFTLVVSSFTPSGSSILIGDNTSTGGFSNSIAIGSGSVNTDTNQFLMSLGGATVINIGGTNNNEFIGYQAGIGATGAVVTEMIGYQAGANSTGALGSQFIGYQAGFGSVGAAGSFIGGIGAGNQAGATGGNAQNSVFIGNGAGGQTGDRTLNNGGTDGSIAIGFESSTGGFSNSIAFGSYAVNTSTNELQIGSTTKPVNTAVINGTGALTIPVGTTAERPASPTVGMIRYNSDIPQYEKYLLGTWIAF